MEFVLMLFLMFVGGKGTDTTAYICDSPNAKKYHLNTTCRGLNNCTYRIKKTTVAVAKRSGKTICRWED